MAHFAEIKDSVVQRVIVIANDVISNAEALDGESMGIEFCKSLYGDETQWVQTSYSGSFRGCYAGIGYTYDAVLDEFVAPTPIE